MDAQSPYFLGTQTEWLEHGCSSPRLLEHERKYGLGMDAPVTVFSWNTNGIRVWAWMSQSPYLRVTRTELWFGHGCFSYRILLEHERTCSGCSGFRVLLERDRMLLEHEHTLARAWMLCSHLRDRIECLRVRVIFGGFFTGAHLGQKRSPTAKRFCRWRQTCQNLRAAAFTRVCATGTLLLLVGSIPFVFQKNTVAVEHPRPSLVLFAFQENTGQGELQCGS